MFHRYGFYRILSLNNLRPEIEETNLNILAAEKSPSEISIGSHVSHCSRGKEAEFELAFFAISFCTYNNERQ